MEAAELVGLQLGRASTVTQLHHGLLRGHELPDEVPGENLHLERDAAASKVSWREEPSPARTVVKSSASKAES